MKVICKRFLKDADEYFLIIGKEYLVIEILLVGGILQYRISRDEDIIPLSFNAEQFTISDNRIYSDWAVYYDHNLSELWISPARWLDNSLWQYSFWEDLCGDDDEKARQVFEEELEKMIAESEL